ncbi:MAG: hypothetical protein J5676_14650 [Bacteroidaceae bacterium]|nr:hypothetical protein [Bacteroidaceae bacterium]
MKRIILIIFLLCLATVILPFFPIVFLLGGMGCGRNLDCSDSIDTTDELVVSKTSLVSHDIGELKAVEGLDKSSLNNYIKSGRLMVLDSGDVVSVINEDESLDYLRVETCGDLLWINKQNVTEVY